MVKKLIRHLFFKKRMLSTKSANDSLIEQGVLSVGERVDVKGCNIVVYGAIPKEKNIEIGDDCIISGTIVLYNSKAKVVIGNRVFIGPNSTLFCYDSIEIGNDVMISWGCTLIDTNAHSIKSEERLTDVLDWKKGWEYKNWAVVNSRKIVIQRKCWVGFNSIITKGVLLKEGCVVASGSVVTKNFEEYSILGGNPAAFIKKTT